MKSAHKLSGLLIALAAVLFGQRVQGAAFSLNQTSVTIETNAGAPPASDSSTILTNNTLGDLTISFSVSTTSGGNWLSASIIPNPLAANGTATITITANTDNLGGPVYTGTVLVSAGGTTVPINVTVLIVVGAGGISASPSAVSISPLPLGAPQSRQIHVSGSGNVAISTSGGSWLSVSANSLASPANFNVIMDPSTLSAGNSYSGAVTLQCVNGTVCSPISISVNVVVTAATPLTITTASLPSGTVNQAYSATLSASGGTAPYTWTASFPSNLPLIMSPSGVITGTPTVVAQNVGFQVSVQVQDRAGNLANKVFTIFVFGVPTLTVSPPTVSLSSQYGTTSASQTVHVSVNTIDAITVPAAIAYQKGSGWLNATQVPGAYDYSLAGNASALSPGTYTAIITISCQGCQQSPQAVGVSFTVISSGLLVSPNSLTFSVATGAKSASQSLSVGSNGGSLYFSATSDPWIILNPPSAITSSSPTAVSVSVDATTLSPGPHTGSIVFSCGANCTAPTISVTANVAANLAVSPHSLSFQGSTNGPLPASQTINVSASDSEGFSFTYSPQASWLSVTTNQNTTPAVLTVSIVSIPAQSGTGSITITPTNGSAPITVQVTLTVSASTAPAISSIVTASDFGGFSTIAPGTYIEIHGTNLSLTNPGRTWAGSDFTNNGQTAPKTLDGTTVLIGSENAFVEYISPTQVNALVPSDVGTGPMQVIVQNQSGASAPYSLTVNPVEPGMLAPAAFKINGIQYAAALFADGTFAIPAGAIAGVASRPAHPGETIVIYALGFGPVTPAIAAGTVVSQANTLASPLQILIGGVPVVPSFAGLAPAATALYQFNVPVPQVPDSNAVPLTFNVAGVAGTQTLYIAVHQ